MSNYYQPSNTVLPPVIKGIIIINVIVFIITSAAQYLGFKQELFNLFALHYYASDLFQPHQFVTYGFMHGGLGHIFFNMFALWMFGAMLENYWGSKRFLIYFIFTVIGAGITQMASQYFELSALSKHVSVFVNHPDPMDFRILFEQNMDGMGAEFRSYGEQLAANFEAQPHNVEIIENAVIFAQNLIPYQASTPLVGASGGVYGILLAFGMMFPNMLIYLYFLIPIKAKYFVIGYGLLELYTSMQNNPGDNVAHLAHLGGMIFGLIMILMWRKRDNHFNY
jgi:membrane associated rhomboid family serine protease